MPNINLPTGNTIYVSAYEYYFVLSEDKVDEFFQSCMADNLGIYIDNPFSSKSAQQELKEEDEEETVKELDGGRLVV